MPPSPRQMFSQSPVFEAGYTTFLSEVFERDIKSVTSEETADRKAVVLADCTRVVLTKSTGLMHCEKRAATGTLTEASWERVSGFPVPYFWLTETEAASAIRDAWHSRVVRHVPSPAECYPKGVPKSQEKTFQAIPQMWETFVDFAAIRRLGSRLNRRACSRTFIGLLWNFLVDRDTLRLCHAYFGRRATLQDYNFTVRRAVELRARLAETPGLTPLIGHYIRAHAELRSGRRVLPTDIVSAIKTEVFAVRDVAATPLFGHVRFFRPAPLTPEGWRYLASSTRTTVELVWNTTSEQTNTASGDGAWAGRRLAPLLNILAKLDQRPPLALVRWASQAVLNLHAPDNSSEATSGLVRLLRLASRQAEVARKRGRLKQFISGDLSLVWDWFRNDEGRRRDTYQPAAVPKNATWASLMRAQQAWHAARVARANARRLADEEAYRIHQAREDARSWDSPQLPCELAGFHVTALTTGKALREEGTRMAHCVADYTDDCAEGHSRIYSLVRGEQSATLELARDRANTWRVGQVFGPENSPVSKELRALSRAMAKLYGEASKAAADT
jgi:hypothetical protein